MRKLIQQLKNSYEYNGMQINDYENYILKI